MLNKIVSVVFSLWTLLRLTRAFVIPIDSQLNFQPNVAVVKTYLYGEPNPEWLKYLNKDGFFDPSLLEPNHSVNFDLSEQFYDAVSAVKFYLYTKKEMTRRQIILEDLNSIKSSTFDSAQPIRFLIHGWQNDDETDSVQKVKNAFLQKGDFNVFSVDWGNGANSTDYYTSRHRIGAVADVTKRFIEFLVKNMGVKTSQMQMIGHSLGAHIAGLVGKRVSAGRFPVIVGLDPALLLFSIGDKDNRLDVSDADYVEVVHTTAGSIGFAEPIGKADFYPNYGKSQPGCGIDLTGSCAHGRAYEFFSESITSQTGFWAKQCGSYAEIKNGNCITTGKTSILGGDPMQTTKASGIYHLVTNTKSPFALGK